MSAYFSCGGEDDLSFYVEWCLFLSIYFSTPPVSPLIKHQQISHTFYPKIFVSNQGCSLSVRRSSDTIH